MQRKNCSLRSVTLMKNEGNGIFCRERIRQYFLDRELVPLPADEYLNCFGDLLVDYFQTTMDILLPQKRPVLGGYYAADVKTEQKYVRKFFRTPEDSCTVIFMNIMLHRFLMDVYLLEETESYKQVLGMYRKYLPVVVGSPSEEIRELLSCYLPPDLAAKPEKLSRSINLAFISVTFTLIHESVHLMPELYRASEQLIRSSALFQELDEASVRELACDFSAVYILLARDSSVHRVVSQQMRVSAEELACCAFVALHAESLYQLFRRGLYLGTSIFVDMGELIDLPLKTRIKNLGVAMKITSGTDPAMLSIGPLDVTAALDSYGRITVRFLTGLAAALEIFSELSRRAEEKGIDLRITPNDPLPPESVWFSIDSK